MSTLLNQRGAAMALRLSERTLERMRCTGDGPKFAKLGRRVLYRTDDLAAWIATCLRTSTSDTGAQR